MSWLIDMYATCLRVTGRVALGAVVWGVRFVYGLVSRAMKPSADVVAASDSERALARVELGAVALAGLAHFYWADWEWRLMSPTYVIGRFLEGQMVNGGYWGVAVLLSMLVLFAGAHRDLGQVASECRPSALAVGTMALLGSLLALAVYAMPRLSGSGGAYEVVVALGTLVFAAGLFVALGVAMFQGVRYRFRASESARALLPISVLLVSLWALCTSVMRASSDGLEPGFPVGVSVVLAFVGPLGACAWGVWELRLLHRSGGIFTPRSLVSA